MKIKWRGGKSQETCVPAADPAQEEYRGLPQESRGSCVLSRWYSCCCVVSLAPVAPTNSSGEFGRPDAGPALGQGVKGLRSREGVGCLIYFCNNSQEKCTWGDEIKAISLINWKNSQKTSNPLRTDVTSANRGHVHSSVVFIMLRAEAFLEWLLHNEETKNWENIWTNLQLLRPIFRRFPQCNSSVSLSALWPCLGLISGFRLKPLWQKDEAKKYIRKGSIYLSAEIPFPPNHFSISIIIVHQGAPCCHAVAKSNKYGLFIP